MIMPMLMVMAPWRGRPPAVLALLTASVFLVFLTELAPHLVHHLFEGGHAEHECPFATAGDHKPATPSPDIGLTALAAPTASVHCSPEPSSPPLSLTLPASRAPPLRTA